MDQAQPVFDSGVAAVDQRLIILEAKLDNAYDQTFGAIADQMLGEISDILHLVHTDHLGMWHFRQKRPSFCDETQYLITCLNQIDVWFNRMAVILKRIRELCVLFASSQVTNMRQCIEKTCRLFDELLARALVVDQQPEQVIKKQSCFQLKVRILLQSGYGFLNSIQGHVKIMLVHESQLQQPQPKRSADIWPRDCETIAAVQPNPSFGCHFQNLKLRNFVRPERKDKESVTDDKYAIHIAAEFERIDGPPIVVFHRSLPVVVTVHGTQEPQAWATVLWDNAFSDVQRNTFGVTKEVSWGYLATALNAMAAKKCGRLMKIEHVRYVGSKLFGSEPVADDCIVSWQRFCKDLLPGCSFTFWDWFYAAMKLIEDKHKVEWKNDRIEGFLSRRRAEEKLSQCVPGTFLLRFQESVLGNLSLAVLDQHQQVLMVDLSEARQSRSLDKIISGLELCVHLYPDIPKQIAFTFPQDSTCINWRSTAIEAKCAVSQLMQIQTNIQRLQQIL